MRAAQHTCQTTFAGGVNPWGEYVPPELRPPTIHPVKQTYLDLLADGLQRSAPEVAKALGIKSTTADENLRHLWRDGRIQRELRPVSKIRPGNKAIFVYFILGVVQ